MGTDKKKSQATEAAELRRRAEELVCGMEPHDAQSDRINNETLKLVHELQVYQVELEMQNAELRRARDDQETLLEKYTELYDFAPVGYFTFDTDGVIHEVNLAGAQLLGIERIMLVNRPFSSFIADADDREIFANHLTFVMQRQVMMRCKIKLLATDGTMVRAQLQSIIISKENKIDHILTSIIDDTIRSQLEDKLEVLHKELVARSAELADANIELEAFNSTVAHDLRRPLATIHAYCQVIRELCCDKFDEQSLEYVREIYDGTQRMNRLIATLLDFSRVKRIEMRLETVDLSVMARGVAAKLKKAAPESHVTFRIAEGIMGNGDGDLLHVVLDNLICNAWKHSGQQEEKVIEFGVTKVDGKPAFFIRDNGPGFDMAHAEKLFVPFQRLPGADVEGHGIGLATVDRIVRRHGGRVWAESKPGEGATFFFTLE